MSGRKNKTSSANAVISGIKLGLALSGLIFFIIYSNNAGKKNAAHEAFGELTPIPMLTSTLYPTLAPVDTPTPAPAVTGSVTNTPAPTSTPTFVPTSVPTKEPASVVTKSPTQVPTPAVPAFSSEFTPLCYPDLADIIKEKYDTSKLSSLTFLQNTFYIVDPTTSMDDKNLFNISDLLNMDNTIVKDPSIPQILIYHTHASERYADSVWKNTSDSVVGIGETLAQILTEKYGYNVIHHTKVYDVVDGVICTTNSYIDALPDLEEILAKNPGIEVVIDLHRDSGSKRVTTVNGKSVARIMLFNGLCRTQNGPLSDYPNENLKANLSFSLQLQIVGNAMYPGIMYRNYLKAYRYNQHLVPKYLLIELGTVQNTVAEARNAMEPFADILNQVLSHKNATTEFDIK